MPTGIYKHIIHSGSFKKGHPLIGGGSTGKHWKLSEETKKKISLATKGKKKQPLSAEHKKKISAYMKTQTGEMGHNWKGGIRKQKNERNDSAYNQWVIRVKKRDNYICKLNRPSCKGYCIVHHILSWRDYPELRYNINNGITLCQFHHPLKRKEEQRLIPFFQSMVEVI